MKKSKSKKLQEDTLFNNAGNGNYTDPKSTEDVIRYVTRTNKQSKKDLLAWGGFGISESLGIKTVINQFHEVQKLNTRKGPFGRYMDHEWYSFSETNHTKLLEYNVDLDSLAREMARDFYERDNCQVVYGIHQPDDTEKHIHIHFAINAVNYDNGNKRRENMRQTKEREKRFREMTQRAITRYKHLKKNATISNII